MDNDLLQRYFEGNTTAEEREEVLLWVESSEDNRKEYLRLRRLYDIALISEKEQSEDIPRDHAFKPLLRWGISVAAVFACALLVWAIYEYSAYRGVETEIPKLQVVEVGVGQQVKLTLPDSTVVFLNSNSKFSYPMTFGKDSRIVDLDGEGYFEVRHHSDHPFIVRTKQFDIRVLGTVFNVMAYSNLNTVETTLLKGSVQMSSIDNQYSVRLRPLQKATYTESEGLTISVVDIADETSWKDGIITFNNESLPMVFRCLEQYYRVKFIFDPHQIDNFHCTGKFSITSDINHIVKVLAEVNNFTYQISKDSTTIYIQ